MLLYVVIRCSVPLEERKVPGGADYFFEGMCYNKRLIVFFQGMCYTKKYWDKGGFV